MAEWIAPSPWSPPRWPTGVESERAWQAWAGKLGATEAEMKSIQFRVRFMWYAIEGGDVLTSDNVRAIRPGLGLRQSIGAGAGQTVKQNVKRGDALDWRLL